MSGSGGQIGLEWLGFEGGGRRVEMCLSQSKDGRLE
jgi:hypothetical protein